MKNKKNTSVKSSQSGKVKFYTSYKAAMKNARYGDVVTIHASLHEQIFLKHGVDIIFADGLIIERQTDSPPLIKVEDDQEGITCTITALAIQAPDSGDDLLTDKDPAIEHSIHSTKKLKK